MFKIEKKEIMKGLISLRFESQYEMTSTFMRLQEFYESPFKEIKGKVFSLETFMDRYAKENGDFTYTGDWAGFNVPGHIVIDFFNKYNNNLLIKEKHLADILFPLNYQDKFYIIGHDEPCYIKPKIKSIIAHEIAHGLYYLNSDYKKEMSQLIKDLPDKVKKRMAEKLKYNGYCKQVIPDEIQAYFSTSSSKFLIDFFGANLSSEAKKFTNVFKRYFEKCK